MAKDNIPDISQNKEMPPQMIFNITFLSLKTIGNENYGMN